MTNDNRPMTNDNRPMITLQIENLPNDFQRNLSELLSRVELGEEIIILNQGVAIAKLISIRPSSNRRASLGLDRGKFIVPENFNKHWQI